ncbi:MAG: LamG-like jellyroll fold domain-containing protein [Bacteroidia bacterium]
MKKTFTILLLLISIVSYSQNSLKSVSGESLYSWESQQAKVLPNGDLQWAPLAFQLVKGSSVRYIDFEGGNDTNDGLSTSTAWKHHPWDATATGNAKTGSGIQTYIFKRGVVYRGVLTAKESGAAGNPIRLSSNPDWGTGEAGIYGSVKISGGWTKANSTLAPSIPNADLVWYKDVPGLENPTKVVCEVSETGIKRVYLARSPNFVNTPKEPMQTWWSFSAKAVSNGVLNLTDNQHLVQTDPNFYVGGDVWAIEGAIVMCTLWKQKILGYFPATKKITVSDPNFGGKDCKYYIENTPFLLDAPGEYYYDRAIGRIFLRLEGDKDPNTTTVEIASKSTLINISAKNFIEISGLTFGFTTCDNVRYGTTDGVPTIKISNSSNIAIRNCKFQYLNGGVLASGAAKNLVFSDNEMNFMDDFCLFLEGPDEISILRNKIFETGTRHLGRWYSSIPAINGELKVGEIAGNIIEHSWGSGINFVWGKGSDNSATIPFIRGLVHHNKVSHSLQGVNDYGGIEGWQGGPAFYYNNISEDAQGWHYDWNTAFVTSLGYPFYFDGASKQYIFNNIVKGTGFDRTGGAYNQVLGFYNMYVNNVAYNVRSFTASGDGTLALDGSNYYLGNVSDSTWHQFDHTTRSSGVPYESIGNNFFSGKPFIGNFLSPGGAKYTFSEFESKLNSFTPDIGQVGIETSRRVFEKPSSGDFRPTASSELIDRGVKFFAPFPLSSVVGEWHFQKHRADSTLIKGENFYFTSEFVGRENYKNVPKNNLKAFGLSAGSFVIGNLEDFAEGALVFDGTKTYCSLNNSVTSKSICNNVDMTTNSFILECYFKTTAGHTGGTLLSKSGASGYGYRLDVDASGNLRFSILNNGNSEFSLSGSGVINDGNWHHVLLEVNRQLAAAKVYVDGIASNGATSGLVPVSASLTNSSDFLIGKSPEGNYFSGTIDFVRISKGTLADAKTTIEELYKWEFDGPFLRDFAGNLPIGKRDAGALERGAKLCDMAVSENPVYFGLSGGTRIITVDAEKGFEISKTVGTFISSSVNGNSVSVTVPSIAAGTKRSGEIYILGCNETRKISIVQQQSTAINILKQNEIQVMPNPVSEQKLTVSLPENMKIARGTLMDLNGKILSLVQLFSGSNSMNISLKSGMYLMNISGTEVNYTTKIVVN